MPDSVDSVETGGLSTYLGEFMHIYQVHNTVHLYAVLITNKGSSSNGLVNGVQE